MQFIFTLLRSIMVRMSDWALPLITLSLSLATSSSSGPRGGTSGSDHHGLNGDIQDQTVTFVTMSNIVFLMFHRDSTHLFAEHLFFQSTFRNVFLHNNFGTDAVA